MLRKVFSLPGDFHVLVVDDGSPDGTANIVKSLQQEFPGQLFLKEREGKQGLGTAYILGFDWALKRNYTYIFEMDADFSHNPDDLLRLLAAVKKNNSVAIGSRYVRGGKIKNWPANRVFISFGASVYTRLITWMPVKDCTAGFVCYHRNVLARIPFEKVRFIGYAFQIEMKYLAWKAGFPLKEIPITFEDRKEGNSKMSKNIIKEAIFGVWKMRSG